LLARRSVYCSKSADGEHSIGKSLNSKDGNIWYQRNEHLWDGTKCKFCGATRSTLDRNLDIENCAYAFIHTDDIKSQVKKFFGENMQFEIDIEINTTTNHIEM
jgi:site-specific DNA-methyltransferase (adenine-specific)